MRALVLRAVDSSLSYRLVDRGRIRPVVSGGIRGIGGDAVHSYDYGTGRGEGATAATAMEEAIDRVRDLVEEIAGPDAASTLEIVAYLFPSGARDAGPVGVVDDAMLAERENAPGRSESDAAVLRLARAGRAMYPAALHLAVMDDAFFSTLPPESAIYLLPESLTRSLDLRRRGYRGVLHAGALRKIRALLDVREPRGAREARARERPSGEAAARKGRVVLCYVEGAAGVTAVHGDRTVWTTFGLSRGDGLPGELAAGAVDLGVLEACVAGTGASLESWLPMLRTQSGLGAVDGNLDRVSMEAERGVESSRTRWAAFVQAIAAAVAGAVALMGGVDAVGFLGRSAVGSARLRRDVCARLGVFGIRAPEEVGAAAGRPETGASGAEEPRPLVVAVPVDEDEEIERIALQFARTAANGSGATGNSATAPPG